MVLRLRSLKSLGKHVRIRGDNGTKATRRRVRSGPSVPQAMLWELVRKKYPDAEEEKRGLVPGRRYVVDIVIERVRLVLEIDGWEWHGRHKSGFKRDREKDRALLLAGYRVVRFYASEIMKDPDTVLATLDRVVDVIESERRSNNDTSSDHP